MAQCRSTGRLISAVLSVTLVFGLTACSLPFNTSSSQDTSSSQEDSWFDESDTSTDVSDTSWVPQGFDAWDDNIAWRWVDRDSDCGDCVYWHIQVISNFGCPSGIYASINIEENGEVIDWTNDTLPYLGGGQKAVLAFEKYLPGSGSDYQGSLTELNCR